MRNAWILNVILVVCGVTFSATAWAAEYRLHEFERVELTGVYYSEGANAGDINGDGVDDVVYGPYWFAGPDYRSKREIYPAKAQPRQGYADNFFNWIYDFNRDGRNDVFVVGFPGTPAFVYENPGGEGLDSHWKKHQVFDWVSNESPHFINLVGDERPELVCTRDGRFGYATINPQEPLGMWTFHAISDDVASKRFGHGLGVGDVNGDGRQDVLAQNGWYEQPKSLDGDPKWPFHQVTFAGPGGAEMYAYDVDGDGDNDVITSLAAHDFGLAWYEQLSDGDKIVFRKHLIMGDRPDQNRYGVLFSELHSVNLADIDGDGLKDIVTGKTYWSHHTQSPMWDAGAVVYWFRLVRDSGGVDWVPYKADGDSGIGRQVIVKDVNGDKLPDIVVGGMKGANVLIHHSREVGRQQWLDAQPELYSGPIHKPVRGSLSPNTAETGRVVGAIEGETMKILGVTAGNTRSQKMGGFTADRWSGADHLFWTGAEPGDRLELELPVSEAGKYDVQVVLTKARDYAVVRISLDGRTLGETVDLYNSPDVITTGVLTYKDQDLPAGRHKFAIEITGANPSAVKSHMVGLDYVRLVR